MKYGLVKNFLYILLILASFLMKRLFVSAFPIHYFSPIDNEDQSVKEATVEGVDLEEVNMDEYDREVVSNGEAFEKIISKEEDSKKEGSKEEHSEREVQEEKSQVDCNKYIPELQGDSSFVYYPSSFRYHVLQK